ncbi:hypothetical protein Ddye_000628 [Dipteronia dyeriana]|uniref:Pentatricopeptide repeat-containing protein n=1 Tax=Dipteronia dyeriana TaxID=168575 RepID=A0AAD9XM23_9ROSI|nr:hypothetical protein Ddye_000628 [Dipteronia dyeriana]
MKAMDRAGVRPNTVTYNTLIDGYCKKENLEEAKQLFEEMEKDGVRHDILTYSILIDVYCKKNKLVEAKLPFEEMEKEETKWLVGEMEKGGVRLDTITDNSLIDVYCKEEKMEQTYKLKSRMEASGVRVETTNYNLLINVSCKKEDLKEAERLFEKMEKKDMRGDKVTYTILIDKYCKKGNMTKAHKLRGWIRSLEGDCVEVLGYQSDIVVSRFQVGGSSKRTGPDVDSTWYVLPDMSYQANLKFPPLDAFDAKSVDCYLRVSLASSVQGGPELLKEPSFFLHPSPYGSLITEAAKTPSPAVRTILDGTTHYRLARVRNQYSVAPVVTAAAPVTAIAAPITAITFSTTDTALVVVFVAATSSSTVSTTSVIVLSLPLAITPTRTDEGIDHVVTTATALKFNKVMRQQVDSLRVRTGTAKAKLEVARREGAQSRVNIRSLAKSCIKLENPLMRPSTICSGISTLTICRSSSHGPVH